MVLSIGLNGLIETLVSIFKSFCLLKADTNARVKQVVEATLRMHMCTVLEQNTVTCT